MFNSICIVACQLMRNMLIYLKIYCEKHDAFPMISSPLTFCTIWNEQRSDKGNYVYPVNDKIIGRKNIDEISLTVAWFFAIRFCQRCDPCDYIDGRNLWITESWLSTYRRGDNLWVFTFVSSIYIYIYTYMIWAQFVVCFNLATLSSMYDPFTHIR